MENVDTIRVQLGERSYDIALTSGGSADAFVSFTRLAAPTSNSICIVSDIRVAEHAGRYAEALASRRWNVHRVEVPSGEGSKSQPELGRLYDALAEMQADRATLVLAVGGGVIGDLAGFAAASYNRGIPLLMAPTTLLAMVDSSVGGKVGINHARGKNLIGAFHQPVGVWIDTASLVTLPEREYLSGLAEVVKYGVILDARFFAWLESNAGPIRCRDANAVRTIVRRSCELKASVVEQDERELTGLRAMLNYGHTFAHAFETVSGYGTWLHGEAVAAGMVCASRLAEKLGRIPAGITERQIQLLCKFDLPIAPRPEWNIESLMEIMRRDKKSQSGKLRFVLPRRLGEVELVAGVPEHLVAEVLTAAPTSGES